MWTTKEVLLISIATGVAFCLATLYSQRKFRQYIDKKVVETSSNPLSSILNHPPIIDNKNIESIGQMMMETNPHVPVPEPVVIETKPICVPRPPDGSGERWTPYP